MRLVDGRYECAQCGAVLALAQDAQPMVVFHAASGKSTVRVITVDGREVHRCEARDRASDPKH
jgi:hypothetical protein